MPVRQAAYHAAQRTPQVCGQARVQGRVAGLAEGLWGHVLRLFCEQQPAGSSVCTRTHVFLQFQEDSSNDL